MARQLSTLLNAKIVDNHWINNPIFGLLDNDRVSPFPSKIWDHVDKVREAVLETIATLSAPDASFIFTHAGRDDDADDHAIYNSIAKVAEHRNALFIPVRLLCSEEELTMRITQPDRRERLKSMDPERARRDARTKTVLNPDHENTVTIDVTETPPQECARLVMDHAINISIGRLKRVN